MQEEFNADFAAKKQRKQADLDKIFEASSRMAAITDELAHTGVAVGEGSAPVSWTHTADNAEDSVLVVQARYTAHMQRKQLSADNSECQCCCSVTYAAEYTENSTLAVKVSSTCVEQTPER